MKAFFYNRRALIGFANSDQEFRQILKESGYMFDVENITSRELCPSIFNTLWLGDSVSNFKDVAKMSQPLEAEEALPNKSESLRNLANKLGLPVQEIKLSEVNIEDILPTKNSL